MQAQLLSCIQLLVIPLTVAARFLCQWNFPGKNTGVLLFPSPGDLPDPGIKPVSPGTPALAG